MTHSSHLLSARLWCDNKKPIPGNVYTKEILEIIEIVLGVSSLHMWPSIEHACCMCVYFAMYVCCVVGRIRL